MTDSTPYSPRELASRRLSDEINLCMAFYDLKPGDAGPWLDEYDGDLEKAKQGLAEERWSKLEPAVMDEYMDIVNDKVAAYVLYQDDAKEDRNFYEQVFIFTGMTKDEAREWRKDFRGLHGKNFLHDVDRFVAWYHEQVIDDIRLHNGYPPEVDSTYQGLTADQQQYIKDFRRVTFVCWPTALRYSERHNYRFVNDAIIKYHSDHDAEDARRKRVSKQVSKQTGKPVPKLESSEPAMMSTEDTESQSGPSQQEETGKKLNSRPKLSVDLEAKSEEKSKSKTSIEAINLSMTFMSLKETEESDDKSTESKNDKPDDPDDWQLVSKDEFS